MSSLRLPRWLSGKESTCRSRTRRRCGFESWVGKIPWRKKWQPIPVFLPGESHGQRSLAGCSPWCQSWTRLSTQACAHTHENMTEHTSMCAHMKCVHMKCVVVQDFPAGPGVNNLPSNAGMGVWSLVSELKSHMLWGKYVWVFQQEMSACYDWRKQGRPRAFKMQNKTALKSNKKAKTKKLYTSSNDSVSY